jgi:predicted phosphodiesterase
VHIQVLSDLHLEVWPFAPALPGADVVVLAGDIHNGRQGIDWAARTFRCPILYVPGNHEYYDGEFHAVEQQMRDAALGSGVQLLQSEARVLQGVRFLGCTLWTDYSLVSAAERPAVIEAARERNPDFMKIRVGARSFAPEDDIALCTAQRAWLAAQLAQPHSGSTVVITHFAPHPMSIAPAYANHPANPGFVLNLESLMGKADLWIHGHTHTAFDYNRGGTRVVSNPRGYPGEPSGFRPDWLVEV